MNSVKLIERLSNAFGPSGFEDDVISVASEYAKGFANLTESNIRNLYIKPKQAAKARPGRPSKQVKPVVMIDAHSDEVGFMVHSVMPNGMLKIHPLGGWMPAMLPSSTVMIKNIDGELVRGVIASIPPHYRSEAERSRAPEVSDLIVDIGSSSDAQTKEEFKIRIGSPMMPDVKFSYNSNTGMMLGKAFDDRLGCACVLETIKKLSGENLDVEIVGTLTSQEEVGLRGAAVAANTVKPDIAIFFEGCPADDYFLQGHMSQTALRGGPMLRHIDDKMITNPRFQRFALNIAEEKGIPVQEAIRKGGSTNAGPVHISREGVPCIVIGIPVRYIHSHNSYATIEDYNASVELAAEVIRKLNYGVVSKF